MNILIKASTSPQVRQTSCSMRNYSLINIILFKPTLFGLIIKSQDFLTLITVISSFLDLIRR